MKANVTFPAQGETPEVLTVQQVAKFLQVSTRSIYERPESFGGRKIPGVGWRFPRKAVMSLAGV